MLHSGFWHFMEKADGHMSVATFKAIPDHLSHAEFEVIRKNLRKAIEALGHATGCLFTEEMMAVDTLVATATQGDNP